MAYTTINDPSAHFQIATYTGDGNDDRAITNDGNSNLQPDWIWFKNRSTTNSHNFLDSSRGVTKRLRSDDDSAEHTTTTRLKSFDSDGMTISTDPAVNGNGNSIVAWQWKANGGTATATGSESGNNPAYSVQANQTAGFSIITYTGTGAEGDVTHGLGGKPDFILTKNRDDSSTPWVTWHKDLVDANADNGAYIYLDTNGQGQTTTVFYEGDAISSSVVAFKGDNANVNADGTNYLMYCFRSIKGYSKFGSYKGNGNADGTFVYTGFRPSWLMAKRIDSTGNWMMFDVKRDPVNVMDSYVVAHDPQVEADFNFVDFLSNGFKWRHTSGHANADNGSYIYLAFAEHPFVTGTGTPTPAR